MGYLDNAQDKIDKYFKEHTYSDYFYQCLFGELVKVFGISWLISNKHYDAEYDNNGNIIDSNNEDYSYREQLEFYLTYLCGTSGWNLAFKLACRQCELENTLYQYYSELDWCESDIFDGYIADNMLNILFADESKVDNEYYQFWLTKEYGYE